MAAVRFHGPCARRAPSSGHSADGGGTSSGPQHALHSVRWPSWGSLRGPGWARTTSGGRGVWAAPRLHVLGSPRSGLGRSQPRTPGLPCPTLPASEAAWGPRASHTELRCNPTHGCLTPCRWGGLFSGQACVLQKAGCCSRTGHSSKPVTGASLWPEENKWGP